MGIQPKPPDRLCWCRSGRLAALDKPVLWLIGACAFLPFLLRIAQANGLLLGPFAAVIVWVFAVSFDGKSNRVLHLTGDASYSIYLFHQATFNTARRGCNWLHLASPEPLEIVAALAVHLLIALAVGIAIHLLIGVPPVDLHELAM